MFAVRLGFDGPDIGLSRILATAAGDGEGPAAVFLRALAAAVRSGSGEADDAGLDEAGRAQVTDLLAAAMSDPGGSRYLDLARLYGEWGMHARHAAPAG